MDDDKHNYGTLHPFLRNDISCVSEQLAQFNDSLGTFSAFSLPSVFFFFLSLFFKVTLRAVVASPCANELSFPYYLRLTCSLMPGIIVFPNIARVSLKVLLTVKFTALVDLTGF